MSNSRKRHIYISIILQVYSQLAALYGEEIGNVIQGGCDTLLYLGGNDPSTCKFISEFISGEATILSEMHRKPGGFSDAIINTDSTLRQDKRFLLTQQEARAWKDKVLVAKRGELPLKLDPFPWIEHPVYRHGLIRPQSVFSSVQKVADKINELREKEESTNPYAELKDLVASLFAKEATEENFSSNEAEDTSQIISGPVSKKNRKKSNKATKTDQKEREYEHKNLDSPLSE